MADSPAIQASRACSILVVEDEDNIALALQYVIEREGHRHFRVADGADAEATIREVKPDLVLLDIMLPQVSGYDICTSVRDDPALAGTKVLMMTARGSRMQEERALAVGADGFLAKPFSLDDLRAKIRAQIGGQVGGQVGGR